MNCCVCLSDQFQPFMEKNGYQIARCQGCGFLQVNPPPRREELDALYQNPEYFESGGAFGYTSYTEEREAIEQLAHERLALIEQLVKRGRLLDVGCASGYFLRVAQERGWQIEGVEISRVAASSAERLLTQRIYPTLEAAPYPPESVDAATLWEYIEHVPDPRQELLRVRRLLRPGGLLALSTPNAGQIRVQRDPLTWPEFKPPEHLSFFTAGTLTALLRACGFEPVVTKGIAPDIRPPAALQRFIDRCRQRLGDRHSRSTSFWWAYSIGRRVLLAPTMLHHKLILSGLEYCKGIEAYARKMPDGADRM